MAVALGTWQAAVYAAEAASVDRLGRRWPRTSEAQMFLDRLIGSEWFAARWPWLLRCTIERRGSGAVWSTFHALDADGPEGCASEGVLLVAGAPLLEPVVLHELAHLLLPPGTHHGPAFARTLLTLVRHEMGFFAFAELLAALRATEVFDPAMLTQAEW
ncbi:MAG: hypothetical protein NVS3B21_08560 [Acidimicrobiales bacterium]